MRSAKVSQSHRSGAALLIMLLLVVVLCALIWLNPMALLGGGGKGMPWSDESKIVEAGKEVPRPGEQQPALTDDLGFKVEVISKDEKGQEGWVNMFISAGGRVMGVWGGTYKPSSKLMLEVVSSKFEGNIVPSKIYKDENGEDPTKLYFIGAGRFMVMETNSENNQMRTVKGKLYVTGWLDSEYKAVGKVTITSDKKTFLEYPWECQGEKDSAPPEMPKDPLLSVP